MNGKFDKVFPGLQNKLHLLVDMYLAVMGLFLSIQGRIPLHMVSLCMAAACAWTLAAVLTRLYAPCSPRRLWDNLVLRFVGVVSATVAVMACDTFFHGKESSGFVPATFVVFYFCSSSIGRILIFKPLSRFSKPVQDVLIIGTEQLGLSTYDTLRHADPEHRCRVVGFVALSAPTQPWPEHYPPILGSSDQLLDIVCQHPVSEIYVAARVVEHAAAMQEIVDTCERIGMPFALPLHSLKFERAQLLSSSPARDGYLHYMSTAWKPMQYAVKRFIDIVASATALVFLAPLLLAVACAIKVTSKGAVLFKQKRVGLHGVTFNLLKFRSMVVNAEELKESLLNTNEQTGPVFKMKNDPRITSIGRFIRKYSIDELPQLINILRGDMTLVGPRPAVLKEVAQYKVWQRRRLSVRPGLTCYWQVGGRNAIGFEEWMRLDLRYVDHWSLAVDMQLILQTFPAVLAGRGAS